MRDLVVGCLDSDEVVVRLALTSSFFYRLVLPDFREAIIGLPGSWAGDRVVRIATFSIGVPSNCLDMKPFGKRVRSNYLRANGYDEHDRSAEGRGENQLDKVDTEFRDHDEDNACADDLDGYDPERTNVSARSPLYHCASTSSKKR
ncbi:hypothetical protein B0A48_16897 [Cryoendolithus antarcticus]|uniref:Uncharacterized protein n=1 Tax=Cryoendolithus antarcticus TaxID=1507870 RepID=A0A1V8SDC7_9PEZI|nr:hypothetical protein B0A48_16897 [Cryoendolithus antarcticus]